MNIILFACMSSIELWNCAREGSNKPTVKHQRNKTSADVSCDTNKNIKTFEMKKMNYIYCLIQRHDNNGPPARIYYSNRTTRSSHMDKYSGRNTCWCWASRFHASPIRPSPIKRNIPYCIRMMRESIITKTSTTVYCSSFAAPFSSIAVGYKMKRQTMSFVFPHSQYKYQVASFFCSIFLF